MSEDSLWTYFNGTGGFVDRPASRDRATEEAASGELSARQRDILRELIACGERGSTWNEMGQRLELHHGQVSGALSNLHKAGLVFTLREKRDKCHPYVHADYRDGFGVEERFDEPASTQAGRNNEAVRLLVDACRHAVATNYNYESCMRISELVKEIDNG